LIYPIGREENRIRIKMKNENGKACRENGKAWKQEKVSI